VTANDASAQFPEGIDFHLEAESAVPIESVELRFHTDAQVYGGDTEAAPLVMPDSAVGITILTGERVKGTPATYSSLNDL
jgi:hypothetical protein